MADFVAMGRKLLADPDLPRKLTARTASIRPCIYQYRCIGNIYVGEPLRCVANAYGPEHDVGLAPARHPQRALVGGGPAGLGVARTLAMRARGDRLGGRCRTRRSAALGRMHRGSARATATGSCTRSPSCPSSWWSSAQPAADVQACAPT